MAKRLPLLPKAPAGDDRTRPRFLVRSRVQVGAVAPDACRDVPNRLSVSPAGANSCTDLDRPRSPVAEGGRRGVRELGEPMTVPKVQSVGECGLARTVGPNEHGEAPRERALDRRLGGRSKAFDPDPVQEHSATWGLVAMRFASAATCASRAVGSHPRSSVWAWILMSA